MQPGKIIHSTLTFGQILIGFILSIGLLIWTAQSHSPVMAIIGLILGAIIGIFWSKKMAVTAKQKMLRTNIWPSFLPVVVFPFKHSTDPFQKGAKISDRSLPAHLSAVPILSVVIGMFLLNIGEYTKGSLFTIVGFSLVSLFASTIFAYGIIGIRLHKQIANRTQVN